MSSNADAIAAEIDQLRVRDISPGLAQLALTIAEQIDAGGNLTALANAARELRAVMEALHKLAPVDERDDGIDQLLQQGEERRVRARRT